jgi:hypothetical protein
MSIVFPTTLDTLTNPNSTDTLDSPSHSDQHSDLNDAVEALETKVGVDSSAVTTSHDYKLGEVTSTDKAVGKSATQTLTNKTIDGDNNTLQDVDTQSLKLSVAFRAYRNAAQTLTDETNNKIELDTESYDYGSDFDTSSYRFTAPVAGLYHFDASVNIGAVSDGARIVVFLRKNGVAVSRGIDIKNGATGNLGGVVSDNLVLAVSDYIELYTYVDSDENEAVTTGTDTVYLSGYLVGTV